METHGYFLNPQASPLPDAWQETAVPFRGNTWLPQLRLLVNGHTLPSSPQHTSMPISVTRCHCHSERASPSFSPPPPPFRLAVNFTDIQLDIRDKAPESYMVTLMRRYMLHLANALAEEKQCLAVANGESLGQVASQTLESMKAIGAMESLPILRPLLSFDKVEIIDLARKIDTYETSILPFQDSCTVFDPKNPVTRPKLEKIEYYESKMDQEHLIQEALNGIVVYDLNYHHKKEEEETFL